MSAREHVERALRALIACADDGDICVPSAEYSQIVIDLTNALGKLA